MKSDWRQRSAAIALVLVGAAAPPASAHAQTQPHEPRLLPHVRYFASPLADPAEPRLAVGLLKTNLFRASGAPRGRERPREFFIPDPQDASSDVAASTAIGGTLPWWQLARWSDSTGVTVGVQAGVTGRFRIEYPTREDVGQDWFVGMPIEFATGLWSGRVRVMHRSSHLGDELVETTGASRVEVGGEFVDFLLAHKFAADTRVYGGAGWTFRSYTQNTAVLRAAGRKDRLAVQLGAEAGLHPWRNRQLGVVGGFDWKRAERTGWADSFAAAAGLSVKTPTRRARLVARYFSGRSLLEQFFLTNETYWALELITDF